MKFSTKKCLLCGEATPPPRKKGKEQDLLLATWDNECISILISVLFQSEQHGKEVVEDLLRTAGYCGPCRLHLRDLSLAHKIVSNSILQIAKLVENIVHGVSIHFAKVSQPWKSKVKKAKGFEEAVSVLFKELQEEDWTLQNFEYIRSAVARSFVREKGPVEIDPLLDWTTEDEDKKDASLTNIVFVEEEAEEYYGNEGDDDDTTEVKHFPCELSPLVPETIKDEDVPSLKNEVRVLRRPNIKDKLKITGDVPVAMLEDQSDVDNGSLASNDDRGDCSDSDYAPLESDRSESEDKPVTGRGQELDDDEYKPPASRKRGSKSIVKDESESEKTDMKTNRKRPAQNSKSSSPPKKWFRKTKQKPRLSKEEMEKSLEQFPISCRFEDCYRRFRSETRMEGHFNKYHLGDDETPYRCTLCKKEDGSNAEEIVGFKLFAGLQKHLRSIHKTVFPCDRFSKHKCPHCGKYFRSAVHLTAHVAGKHEKKSLHGTCDVCSKRFQTVEEMETHKSKIHQGKYPFTCEECTQIFTTAVSLRYHVKQLHSLQDRVMCKICKNKSFLTEERLRFHEYANHPELRGVKFHCDFCDITFKNYYYYRDHRIEFHPELVKAKDYKCLECNKTYKRSNQLASHQLRIHTTNREKKFKCPLCPRAFTSLVSLKGHEESHSGVKYICYICGNQFTAQSHLSRHMKFLHAEGDDSNPTKPRKPRTFKPLEPTYAELAEMESASNSNPETTSQPEPAVELNVPSLPSTETEEVMSNGPILSLVN